MRDDRHRIGAIAPTRDESAGDLRQILHRHVHDDHRRGGGDGLPVYIGRHLAGRIMAGEKDHRVIGVAVGGGQTGISQAADAGGDAGHDAERNPGLDQVLAFFAAAAEHEGIAALEPQHPLALARQFDQAQRDIALLRRRLAAALAGIFEFGAGADPIED